jgi:hypothetical protein
VSESVWSIQSTEFHTGLCKLRDLVTLPAGLNAYRPCPAVHLPVQRRLWKFCDSERMDSGPSVQTVSKHMLWCSSQGQVLVLLGPAQQFTFLCRGGSCGYHVIQRIWAQDSYSISSQHTEQNSGPRGQMLSQPESQIMELATVGGASNHYTPPHWASLHNHIKPSPSPQLPLMNVSQPDTVARCPKTLRAIVFLVFWPPEYLSLKWQCYSQDGTFLLPSKIRGETECLSSPRLAFHTGAVTISLNPCTWFKAFGGVDLSLS